MSLDTLWSPNPGPQTAFLTSQAREVLYGGAAAGGKTDALIMLPLQRVWHPKHRALIMRRTRKELQEVIDRQLELYPQIEPRLDRPGYGWRETETRWRFPSGAIVQLGYAEHEQDVMGFKSNEFDLICFDELTSFTSWMYAFLFTRNRSKAAELPAIIRSATNPGDIGHEWVLDRFQVMDLALHYQTREMPVNLPSGEVVTVSRQFIPAKIADNPKLPDAKGYVAGVYASLGEDAAAYMEGDWSRFTGRMFKNMPIEIEPRHLMNDFYIIRALDYGWDDPTVVYWLAVYPNNQIAVIDELVVDHTTIEGIARYIHGKEEKHAIGSRIRTSVIDPNAARTEGSSAQSISTLLTRQGVWFEKAVNDRISGWAQVHRILGGKRLFVWRGAAPLLMKTLPVLVRDPKKPQDIKKGQNDHAADALRYGLMALFDVAPSRPRPPEPDRSRQDTVFDQLRKDILEGRRDGNAPFPLTNT